MRRQDQASATAATPAGPRTARLSVTLPTDHYSLLLEIARRRKVSAAWVIRDAVERYLADEWPLLERGQAGRERG